LKITKFTPQFPIQRIEEQVLSEFLPELAECTGFTTQELNESGLALLDFTNGTLRIEFSDGSVVEFQRAMHIASKEKCAIAVFTLFCGNHIFPNDGAKIYRDGLLSN